MTSRSLSAKFRKTLFEPFRGDDFRVLLTVNHANFAEPYRFVSADPNEFDSLVSGGNTFISFPFDISILGDDEGEPEAQIRLQNVDDRIGATLLNLPTDTVSITIQIVMSDTPDTIEYEATNLELVDIEINAFQITGKLLVRGLATEPCPGRVLSNKISPVFFR